MYDNFDPLNENQKNEQKGPQNGEYSFNKDELNNLGAKESSFTQPTEPKYEQPVASYSAYAENSYYVPKPKKEKNKKDRKKYPISIVIACCLICSVLGGVAASGAMIFAGGLDKSTSSSAEPTTTASGTTKVVNVSETSTEELVTAVAQKAAPSVVGIRATAKSNSFWGQTQEESGEGSGVIYSSDGYIITNYHVISTAVEATSGNSSINVYLPDDPSTAIPATVVGYYSESDLAVIKIDKTGLTAIEFGDSSSLKVGQTAVAIGNPGGLQYMGSVSSGIISGLNRTLKLEGIEEMSLIQTDAAINPGNSGGALLNSSGQLIGINSSKIGGSSYEGMGFAIPSNFVKTLCDDIISNKDTKRAYIGVKISTEYDSDKLQAMGYPAGALVESVVSGSPADEIGIKAYDIITQVNGVKVSSYKEYNTERLKHKPGETITLQVYRNRQYYDVSITLGESIS